MAILHIYQYKSNSNYSIWISYKCHETSTQFTELVIKNFIPWFRDFILNERWFQLKTHFHYFFGKGRGWIKSWTTLTKPQLIFWGNLKVFCQRKSIIVTAVILLSRILPDTEAVLKWIVHTMLSWKVEKWVRYLHCGINTRRGKTDLFSLPRGGR